MNAITLSILPHSSICHDFRQLAGQGDVVGFAGRKTEISSLSRHRTGFEGTPFGYLLGTWRVNNAHNWTRRGFNGGLGVGTQDERPTSGSLDHSDEPRAKVDGYVSRQDKSVVDRVGGSVGVKAANGHRVQSSWKMIVEDKQVGADCGPGNFEGRIRDPVLLNGHGNSGYQGNDMMAFPDWKQGSELSSKNDEESDMKRVEAMSLEPGRTQFREVNLGRSAAPLNDDLNVEPEIEIELDDTFGPASSLSNRKASGNDTSLAREGSASKDGQGSNGALAWSKLGSTQSIPVFKTPSQQDKGFRASQSGKGQGSAPNSSVESSAQAAPWGEFEGETAPRLKAPQVRPPKGNKPPPKNPFRGRRMSEDPLQGCLTEAGSERQAHLKEGIAKAKDLEAMVKFLERNAAEVASADMRDLIEACFQQRQPDKVFEFIKFAETHLRRPLGSRSLTQLIAKAGRYGDWRSSQKIFDLLQERADPEMDVYAYNALMNVYGKVGLFDEAAAVMEEMTSGKAGMAPDGFSYSSAINHAVKSSRFADVIELFRQMKARKFRPDVVTYGAVALAFCQLGRPAEGEPLLADMVSQGLSPDTTLFTTLVHGYAKIKKHGDVARVLKKMEVAGCLPSVHTYTTLMDMYGKIGDLKKVEQLHVDMLRAGAPPTGPTFNALVSSYARNGQFDKAEAIISQMPATCPPTTRTFTELMDSYAKAGMPAQAEAVFARAKKLGLQPNGYMFTSLVDMRAKLGKMGMAEQGIREMETRGVHQVEAYHALMSGYVKLGDTARAAKVADWMVKKKLAVSAWTWNILIQGYGNQGLFSEMEAVWQRLWQEGFHPVESTWVTMVQAYGKAKMVREARAVFEQAVAGEWMKTQAQPTKIYNAMLGVYAKSQLWARAEEFFQEMKSGGEQCRPDRVSYNTMLDCYGKGGQLEKMEALLREMTAVGLQPDEISYSCVIDAFGRAANFGRALVWLECMQAAGLRPNHVTLNSLIAHYSWAGYHKKAQEWFDRMRAMGVQATESSYYSRIRGYLKMGRFREAEALVQQMEGAGLSVHPGILEWVGKVKEGKVWGLKGIVKEVGGVEVIHRRRKRVGSGMGDGPRAEPWDRPGVRSGIGSARERLEGRPGEEAEERWKGGGAGEGAQGRGRLGTPGSGRDESGQGTREGPMRRRGSQLVDGSDEAAAGSIYSRSGAWRGEAQGVPLGAAGRGSGGREGRGLVGKWRGLALAQGQGTKEGTEPVRGGRRGEGPVLELPDEELLERLVACREAEGGRGEEEEAGGVTHRATTSGKAERPLMGGGGGAARWQGGQGGASRGDFGRFQEERGELELALPRFGSGRSKQNDSGQKVVFSGAQERNRGPSTTRGIGFDRKETRSVGQGGASHRERGQEGRGGGNGEGESRMIGSSSSFHVVWRKAANENPSQTDTGTVAKEGADPDSADWFADKWQRVNGKVQKLGGGQAAIEGSGASREGMRVWERGAGKEVRMSTLEDLTDELLELAGITEEHLLPSDAKGSGRHGSVGHRERKRRDGNTLKTPTEPGFSEGL